MTLQLKARNYDYAVVSVFSGLLIALSVMLPIISMHIITANYARLKNTRFDKKFGSLVTGVERAPLWEKWGIFKSLFYPVFLFQRLIYGCILIYLYPFPVVQISLLMVLHAAVSRENNVWVDDRVHSDISANGN